MSICIDCKKEYLDRYGEGKCGNCFVRDFYIVFWGTCIALGLLLGIGFSLL